MKQLVVLLIVYACAWLIADHTSFVAASARCKSDSVWNWVCENDRCVKVEAGSSAQSTELNTCKLTCGNYSMLFPKPSGGLQLGKQTVPLIPTMARLTSIRCKGSPCDATSTWLLNNAFSLFLNTMQEMYSRNSGSHSRLSDPSCVLEAQKRSLFVTVDLQESDTKLNLTTDESYNLGISITDSSIDAKISAQNFFGARHALETISQLSAYSEAYNAMQILSQVNITNDKPSYPYRGLSLDTSRNFFSVNSILRLIRALSYSKMNTLHWHITDTHSFPIEIKSVPQMAQYGAYSKNRIYSHSDIRRIVSYAAVNGIRILPEFDQPAHCGEGWQWGPKAGKGKLAVCVNREPWQQYCLEPPCGQLNPTNENLYDVLGQIYREYFDLFKPDLFHAGGDEINFNCWNTTAEINEWMLQNYGGVQKDNYLDLWNRFLERSSAKLYQANNGKEIPLILWSSDMTSEKYLTKYLDPSKHIVQIWSSTTTKEMAVIPENGFRTIFSTYDTLYLDCGFGNWLIEGNNWCSPYKDWKLLYDNDPVKILKSFGVNVTDAMKKTILGQESAMWSEQVDESTSEGKIWPRTAALAERLWTNPDHNWRAAEYRMINHRDRLVERGVMADALQPLWCLQNAGNCYYDPSIPGIP